MKPDMKVDIPNLKGGCAHCGGKSYVCAYQGSPDPGVDIWRCRAQQQPGKSETIELWAQLIPPPPYGKWLYQEWRVTYQNGIDDPGCVCRWAKMTDQDLSGGGTADVFGGSCTNPQLGLAPGPVSWKPV